jgi:hypothetical protein
MREDVTGLTSDWVLAVDRAETMRLFASCARATSASAKRVRRTGRLKEPDNGGGAVPSLRRRAAGACINARKRPVISQRREIRQ